MPLSERLGGPEALGPAVAKLFQRLAGDPEFRPILHHCDSGTLEAETSHVLAQILRGEPADVQQYFTQHGMDRRHVHVIVGHLAAALRGLGTKQDLIEQAVALVVSAFGEAPGDGAPRMPEAATAAGGTLYQRIGGAAALTAILDQFYERVLGDPDLVACFEFTDLDRLKLQQHRAFSLALSGPAACDGPGRPAAPAALDIEQHYRECLTSHLVATLSALRVRAELIHRIVGLVTPLAAEGLRRPVSDRTSTSEGRQHMRTIELETTAIDGRDPGTSSAALREVLEIVTRAGTVSEAITGTLKAVCRHGTWTYAAYLRRDLTDGLLKCVTDSGSVSEEFRQATRSARFREGEALSGRAWRARDLVFIEDFGAVEEFARAPIARRAGVRSSVCIPLMINAEVVGTLEFYASGLCKLSADEAASLRKVGYLVSTVVGRVDLGRFASMLNNSPINTVYADPDLVIQYLNPAAVTTLGKVAAHLGAPVERLIGRTLDVIHPDFAQSGPVGDPARLPFKGILTLGPEKFDVRVSAIYDAQQTYMGPMVSWEVVTKKLQGQQELERVLAMVQDMPVNIISCDPDLTIQYLNPASERSLQRLEAHLPIAATQFIGRSLAGLYPEPDRMQQVLSDPANLPHHTQLRFGPETIDFSVDPIFDFKKNYMGPMVTWSIITERLATERQVQEAQERERAQAAELRAQVDAMLVSVSAAAAGDFTCEVTVSGQDVVGRMGEGLAKCFHDLRSSIRSFAAAAGSLTSASEDLSKVSQTMSATAEETSAQATVVSAASDQVAGNVQMVATAAEEMSSSIREIARNAGEAARVAKEGVKAADATNTTVQELGAASVEIGKVIKVITSIAQQTNLLALNATIEAARAGESGRGFAVVANEVKELAKETARATEDIGVKIQAIQKNTQSAVQAIQGISSIILQISDIQSTIASAVEEQTATTNEIVRNAGQAAKGSSEITGNINGVAEAAVGTTKSAGEILSASAELSRMASSLQALIEQFRY